MDELAVKVAEVDARSRSNTKRLDKLEEVAEAIHEQSASIRELVGEIKHTNEHITEQADELEKHDRRLGELEAVPGERWNTMKRTIFTAAVSTLSGGLVGALVMLLAGTVK